MIDQSNSVADAEAPYAVELVAITKSFDKIVANSEINLKARPGTIHAIIGENGAGKSTAMKILYGLYKPDSGEIRIRGKTKRWSSSADAISSGLGMVHQHFMLAGKYSALENILLGAEHALPGGRHRAPSRWKTMFLPARNARVMLDKINESYGWSSINWDAPVESLPVGIQQRIEIIKLIYRGASILILDEPTAVLTPQETANLFARLRSLAKQGKTILIITHKLKEVMTLADEVTVFRAGQVTGHRNIADTSIKELAGLMVGRVIKPLARNYQEKASASAVLEVKKLKVKDRVSKRTILDGIEFTVNAGEVVGVAGVEGNGQSELLRVLLNPSNFPSSSRGISTEVTGFIGCLGEEIYPKRVSAAKIRQLGVGLIPEDRHRDGLLLGLTLWENFLLGLQRTREFSKLGFILKKKVSAVAERAFINYDVKPSSIKALAGELSGGNQQKCIIAREFTRQFTRKSLRGIDREPRLLVAAHPTRGVDIGAIEFIHEQLFQAKSSGCGILLVSSELDEIMALSDRILVMFKGRIIATFPRKQANEKVLGLAMGGSIQE